MQLNVFLHFLPVQAEDYDTRIAGPRREERVRRLEEQTRSIRGFRGEGQTLRERNQCLAVWDKDSYVAM